MADPTLTVNGKERMARIREAYADHPEVDRIMPYQGPEYVACIVLDADGVSESVYSVALKLDGLVPRDSSARGESGAGYSFLWIDRDGRDA